MKKLLVYLAPVMLLIGCAQNLELTEPSDASTGAETSGAMPAIRERSLEGAIYNEVVDAWMIPRKDPYTLENFQKTYDNLATKKSAQTLSKAQASEFAPAKKLAPTHYALKIYPRNEDEQWRVEMMEDVQVAYIPFDYAQLTQREVERLPQTKTRSIGTAQARAFTFAEKSPYTVTYDNYESTDGGPTGPVTLQLPILYTVWPVDKPLPDDLEYVVDHEIFQPTPASPATRSSVATRAFSGSYTVQLTTRDDILIEWIPLANLKVSIYTDEFYYDPWGGDPYRPGFWTGFSMTAVTDNYGRVDVGQVIADYARTFPNDFYCDIYFRVTYQDQNGRWKITPDNGATTPITVINVDRFNYERPIDNHQLSFSGTHQAPVIHRAVNYFFNDQTVFPKPSISGGIRIIASSNANRYPDGSYIGGSFSSPITGSPNNTNTFINIWNNERPNAEVVGTTLHELGHFAHFGNNNSGFRSTPRGFSRILRSLFRLVSGRGILHIYRLDKTSSCLLFLSCERYYTRQ